MIAFFYNIAGISGQHRALLDAGLPRKLVAALQSRDEQSIRLFDAVFDSGDDVPSNSVSLMERLLRGPLAAEAADALVEAGGLGIFMGALSNKAAITCLHAMYNMSEARRADIIHSGAAAALIKALHVEGPLVKHAASALLLLFPEHASVEAEAVAAGFTARRLQVISHRRYPPS